MEPFDTKTENYCYYVINLIIIIFGISVVITNFFNIDIFHLFPNCSLLSSVGYYCPGCGGTRAFISLLHLNIVRSIIYHPFVLYESIIISLFWITKTFEILSKKRFKSIHLRPIYFYIAIALIIIQWIFKNMVLHFFGISLIYIKIFI